MTLLVKRKFNGKKGIFSEKSIANLATSEETIDTGFSRGQTAFLPISDGLAEIAEHLFVVFIVHGT
jgi:hypothetical protein